MFASQNISENIFSVYDLVPAVIGLCWCSHYPGQALFMG